MFCVILYNLVCYVVQLKKERLDFFPLNQAMCLEEGKENTVEDKLEEIMEALGKVHEFQQQQVSTFNQAIHLYIKAQGF